MPKPETIVAAAVRIPVPAHLRDQSWNGRKVYPEYLTVTALPPARHGSLMHPAIELLGHDPGPAHQGFITSAGRYVDRYEALQIVIAADQPQIDHPSRNAGGQLFSEDLW